MRQCPRCHATAVIKNGRIHSGKPKVACNQCGRQFVDQPAKQPIPAETRALVDKLLLERVSLAGIVRVTGVSARWLQYYVNKTYQAQPRHVAVPAQKNGA